MNRISLFKVAMHRNADSAVSSVLRSGYIGQGPLVDQFENTLHVRLGLSDRPVTTNSCTSAIDLALELIGVGPGDHVITTPQTCTATNSPVVKRGAIPVWADVDENGLILPSSVKSRLRDYPQAKAVIAVDWAGRLADYPALRLAAPGLPIVEDAAHRLPDGLVQGDYVCWSFQAIKFLTTGDGGALLPPPYQQARARLLRWYGLDRESGTSFRCAQNIQEVGFKYHMNDISAAIGLANLPLAQENLSQQRGNARYLAHALEDEFVEDSHYWFYPTSSYRRDDFIAHMDAFGIDASQVHARNDAHSAFMNVSIPGPSPGTNWFDKYQVAIPCGWWLTKADLDRIIAAVESW